MNSFSTIIILYCVFYRLLRLYTKRVLLYSLPSFGSGADPGAHHMQSVRTPHVTFKSFSCGRLPLLSARPVITFPAEGRQRPSTSTKSYCLVTEAHRPRCKKLAQGCYAALSRWEFNPRPSDRKSNAFNCYASTAPLNDEVIK